MNRKDFFRTLAAGAVVAPVVASAKPVIFENKKANEYIQGEYGRPPRISKAQRDAIPNPVEGLWIYQTDNNSGDKIFMKGVWVGIDIDRQ